MKIALIELISPIHNVDFINDSLEGFVNELSDNFYLDHYRIQDINEIKKEKYDLILNFVKTGGTENIFKENFKKLPKPYYFLTTSLNNSLPAALEMLSYVRNRNEKGRIFHGDRNILLDDLKKFAKINKVKNKISNSKLGVIGEPSDWLIASEVNYAEVKNKWGLELIDIDLDKVYEVYDDVNEDKVEEIANEFLFSADEVIENDKEDTKEAVKVYLALKKIVEKYKLDALTIRCFDIVEKLNTTGCLALSFLNDEGIVAGCEGDIPSAFTMLFSKYLADEETFMANPYKIDAKNNYVKFAHCTVPTNICTNYISRSHFETGIGVGIQGIIPEGPATVLKIGGKNLDNLFAVEGSIDANLNSPHACRTQIEVGFDEKDLVADYFFKNPIGNHHIIIPGKYKNLIKDFFKNITIAPKIY